MADRIEEDPTIVLRMLEDFRCGTVLERLKNRRKSSGSLATRLKFDTSSLENSLVKRAHSDDDVSETSKKFKGEDLDVSLTAASPWEAHRVRAQLVDARTEIVMLETRISQLDAARKMLEVTFESEKQILLQLQDRDRERIKEMEKRLKVIRRREFETREELLELRKTSDSTRFKLEASVQSLQLENMELRDRLKELELGSHKSQLSSEHQAIQLESELGETVQELVELRDRNTELEERMSEATRQTLQAEQQAQQLLQAQLRIKELERELELQSEVAATVKAQHHRLQQLPELERELATLREEHRHLKEAVPQKLLLEEMVQNLQARQGGLEETERQLAQVQEARNQLEGALAEWRALTGTAEPGALRRHLGELQQTVLVLTDEKAELQSVLKQCEQQKDSLQVKLDKANQASEKHLQQYNQETQLVRRLQKKLLLISRERDGYRSQLDSYEKELTVTSSMAMSSQFKQQQRMRIDLLEKSLEGYRDIVERLEAELNSGTGAAGPTALMERVIRLEGERDELAREKEQLMKRRDELERQLEHRALHGDYDPAASKLLHFRLNPAAEAEAKREDELVALRAECEKLRARVALLQEDNIPNDLTEQVHQRVATSSSQEVQELQEQVKSSELKLQRFMEVFKTSSREFRDVCYALLGYKMDRLQPTHYRLTSMYAESPDEHLMFSVLPGGEVNLLETDYSTTLGELIELHLRRQHSIPMFLCALSQELFSRQTMVEEEEDPLHSD